jgi:hypothetical protein
MNESPTIMGEASPLIRTITFPKCGTCIYAQQFDGSNMADCFGHPPSVHIVGMGKTVLGQPGIQLETFVPRVKKDRPACALYKRQDDFATVGRS